MTQTSGALCLAVIYFDWVWLYNIEHILLVFDPYIVLVSVYMNCHSCVFFFFCHATPSSTRSAVCTIPCSPSGGGGGGTLLSSGFHLLSFMKCIDFQLDLFESLKVGFSLPICASIVARVSLTVNCLRFSLFFVNYWFNFYIDVNYSRCIHY